MKFAGGRPLVPAASDGPVPALLANELALARSGALDTDLLSQQPFYGTNFTKPLLFIEDGTYFVNKAQALPDPASSGEAKVPARRAVCLLTPPDARERLRQ